VLKLTVANLKGGTAKTTTAGFMGTALYECGLEPVGIDADRENEGFFDWAKEGPLPFPCEVFTEPGLDVKLPGILGDRFGSVVIDTPPMQDRAEVVRGAVRWSTHVLIPMAPTTAEYRRMEEVRLFLAETLKGRTQPVVAVMFNRTVPAASATGVFRDQLRADGWHVLRSTAGNIQRYAQAQGSPITQAMNTPFGFALEELLDLTPEIAKVPVREDAR